MSGLAVRVQWRLEGGWANVYAMSWQVVGWSEHAEVCVR
jgi:hypothetical protein